MARTHHAPAPPEQTNNSLNYFLTNDVSIWLQAGSESLAELAELLRAIRKLATEQHMPSISDLANLGIQVAEDYSNCVDCCAEELQKTYLDIDLT